MRFVFTFIVLKKCVYKKDFVEGLCYANGPYIFSKMRVNQGHVLFIYLFFYRDARMSFECGPFLNVQYCWVT